MLMKGTLIQNLAVTKKSYHHLALKLCFDHKQPKNRRGEKEGSDSLITGCFLYRSALFAQIMHRSPLAEGGMLGWGVHNYFPSNKCVNRLIKV